MGLSNGCRELMLLMYWQDPAKNWQLYLDKTPPGRL